MADEDNLQEPLISEEEDESGNTDLEKRVNDFLNKLGGVGLFQWFSFYTIGLGINSNGFWIYILGFLIQ